MAMCGYDGIFSTPPCIANSCAAASVPNSNYSLLGSIVGSTGQTVSIQCNAGFYAVQDGSSAATATTPYYLRNTLGITTNGSYYISTSGLGQSAVVLAEVSFGMLDGKDWVKVFELTQRSDGTGTVVTDLLGFGLPWKGFNVRVSATNSDYFSYSSSFQSYNRGTFSSTLFSGGNKAGDRVQLGASGGHGWYAASTSTCSWSTSSRIVGAGYDGISCGGYPSALIMGIGSSSSSRSTLYSGSWSYWIWMDTAVPGLSSVRGTATCGPTGTFSTPLCVAAACPSNSVGTSLSSGCSCPANTTGSIVGSTDFPFYTYSCVSTAQVAGYYDYPQYGNLGCFQNSLSSRRQLGTSNWQSCRTSAITYGQNYFGLQNGGECWTGGSYDSTLNTTACTTRCASADNQNCGGANVVNLLDRKSVV